jgi:hypothetical protein
MRTNTTKLMRDGKSTQNSEIAHRNMPRQRRCIRQNDMVTNLAIVGDMGISHN